MGTNTASETESPDTDARIDTQNATADRPTDPANPITLVPVGTTDPHPTRSGVFDPESDLAAIDLDEFVADVTTIAQSQCEHLTDYADIETLICCLPIDQLTFAEYDSFAPYSGPYPIAVHVRASLLKEINGWDETALHDHLRAHPSLRQNLGFESLPNQSTLWRAWNERFSGALRDAVQECADAIVGTSQLWLPQAESPL